MDRRPRRSGSRRPIIAEGDEERIVLVLFDLANHLQRRGEQIAGQANITTLQWIVLLQIAGDPNFPQPPRTANELANEPMLASELARERGFSKATISAVVSALKDQGLIREERDEHDRRRRRLVPTPEGVRAIEKLEPLRRASNRRLLGELQPADRRRFLGYLEQCMAVLSAASEDDRVAAAQARLTRSR